MLLINESQRLSEFKDAKRWLCIPPNYGFIWDKLQDIPLLHGSLPMKTNVEAWVGGLAVKGSKTKKVWNVCRSNAR